MSSREDLALGAVFLLVRVLVRVGMTVGKGSTARVLPETIRIGVAEIGLYK